MQTLAPSPAPAAGAPRPEPGGRRLDRLAIRPAGRGDLEAVHRLVNAAYRGSGARLGWTHEADLFYGERTDLGALLKILVDPRQFLLIAGEGDPLGCVQVACAGGGRAHLGMLTVDPEVQAGGLGRRLIEAAERRAAEAFGTRRVEMTVLKQRPELVAYYERRGYRPTGGEAPFPPGETRFGLPTRPALAFAVLARDIEAPRAAG